MSDPTEDLDGVQPRPCVLGCDQATEAGEPPTHCQTYQRLASSSESRTGAKQSHRYARPYVEEPTDKTRFGIAFSGGGVRSAAFCLGAYQSLDSAGMFRQAEFLACVSGGGYIGAAIATTEALSDPGTIDDKNPVWGPGSPEERYLRENLNYLAPGPSGRLWLVANLLYGVLLNLAPIAVGSWLLGRVYGFILHGTVPGIGVENVPELHLQRVSGFVLLGSAALSLCLVAARRFRDKPDNDDRARVGNPEQSAADLLAVAGSTLTFGLILPFAVHIVAKSRLLSRLENTIQEFWFARSEAVTQSLAIGVCLLVALLAAGAVLLLVLRRPNAALRRWLAIALGPILLMIPFLAAAATAAKSGWSGFGSEITAVLALLIAGATSVFLHNLRYSMHPYYRERLQSVYSLKRVKLDDDGGRIESQPIPYRKPVHLSEIETGLQEARDSGQPFPKLVLCASVAARSNEVPYKANAASFTFDSAGYSSPRLGISGTLADLEGTDWLGGGDISLPAVMAISGAALAPTMGRYSQLEIRLLMALLNIRLGVWIRTGKVKSSAVDRGRLRSMTYLVRRELFRLADGKVPMLSYAARGFLEPGSLYVLREGLGLTRASDPFVYVTDGGHWENLGLVELLRRRCNQILVVDATGGADLADLGRALQLARSELGVRFDLDLEEDLGEEPVLVGRFTYPDNRTGVLYIARKELTSTAPADLQLLKSRSPIFPDHPTSNQFLSDEHFEGYRALGYWVGEEAAERIHLRPHSINR